jgi:hypothetical protein
VLAERADQRRLYEVVDGVFGTGGAFELEELVPPVERTEPERDLDVTEDLRRVDGQITTRVDRRAEHVEVDVPAGLGERAWCRCRNDRECNERANEHGHADPP